MTDIKEYKILRHPDGSGGSQDRILGFFVNAMMRRYKTVVFLPVLLIWGAIMNAEEVYTNRLIKEKSPYLLQHAHNPVDWFPWGEEAFEKARKEDKPIFLSIGYSTCHWCHVMEDESFSSRDIADIMNKYFVSIKIDREERPDIDNLYMSAVVSLTGSGGWPLTVFLTPDLKPFYGGTYFPPDDKFGMPGLKTLLLSIADVWKNRRKDALDSAESLTRALQYQPVSGDNKSVLSEETLKSAYAQLLQTFDRRFGGFGKAPKFPASHSISFLLRYWKRSGEKEALKMVEKTLLEMADGGMYDHIGGGFHRYSTDGEWRVPHFEKMLYDQALLSRTCLEAYQATGKEEFARTAIDIFEYVLRDMAHPEGGFYSAEDADSPAAQQSAGSGNLPARKSEGAFYIWGKDEIIKILGREEGDIFCYYFGVEEKGNALQDPQGEFRGKNILYVAHDLEETAGHFKKTPKDVENILKDAKEKIYHSRLKRIRPHLDDKVLVDWNGLMLSSLAFGSRVLNEPRYSDAAEKSARFILKHLKNKDGRLLHRYRDGESIIPGMLDDYAFFVHGLLDLYEATFNPDFLKEAKQLTDEMLKYFWDGSGGGFFITGSDAQKILIRRKEIYDGAIPSGNSMAAIDLLRLGRLTMNKDFETKAESLLKRFSGDISQAPAVYTQMLAALDFALGPSKEIVLTAEKGSIDTPRMINSIYRRFIPNKVVAFRPASGKEAETVIGLIPFLKEQLPLNGKATVYVCENYACNLPVTSVEKMEEILNAN